MKNSTDQERRVLRLFPVRVGQRDAKRSRTELYNKTEGEDNRR